MTIDLTAERALVDAAIPSMRQALLQWYDTHGRDLPWRVKGDAVANPYHVWLSEIMLQQTTVNHALSYFEKFIQKWPTLEDLAKASSDVVMANWAGLGYYARARNMLKCAHKIILEFDGRFPEDYEQLRRLPGLGPYTAAALMAMAFAKDANVVDANIERIMSRLYAIETPIAESKAQLYALAGHWTRNDRARDWPQALMDLASGVCRPKAPACDMCPLLNICIAKQVNAADSYPKRKAKIQKPIRVGRVYVLIYENGVWVERRPEKGLLGGMLGLPHTEWHFNDLKFIEKEHLFNRMQLHNLGTYGHIFTHFELHQEVYLSVITSVSDLAYLNTNRQGAFLPLSEINTLPTVFKKAVKLCLVHIGANSRA